MIARHLEDATTPTKAHRVQWFRDHSMVRFDAFVNVTALCDVCVREIKSEHGTRAILLYNRLIYTCSRKKKHTYVVVSWKKSMYL
jgi:hypothetical protein